MELLDILTKIQGKFLLKQTYVPYIEQWANEHGFYIRTLTLKRSMGLKRGEERGKMTYVFIANYRI